MSSMCAASEGDRKRSCNLSPNWKKELDGAEKTKMSDACYVSLSTRKAS